MAAWSNLSDNGVQWESAVTAENLDNNTVKIKLLS